MKSINIKQKDVNRRKKGKKISWYMFIPTIIIPFLGTFFYLYMNSKEEVLGALSYTFKGSPTAVVYDTYDVFIDENIDSRYSESIVTSLEDIQYGEVSRFNIVDSMDDADVTIEYGLGDYTIYSDYLLPVGHMYWVEDSISSDVFESSSKQFILSKETYALYEDYLNEYYPDIVFSEVEDMVDRIEDVEDSYVGLVTVEELSEEFKLLYVDDKYYLDTFDCGLPVSMVVKSDLEKLSFVAGIMQSNIQIDTVEYSEDNIAKVNMTGVTAITRRLGSTIDKVGDYDYPAENIGDFLADADLTHTSNEISFVEGCTSYSGMRFCSRPEYIATILASGIDVIELTGNHNNDYGSSYNTDTIETYIDEGLGYFGGGLDDEDAAEPYIIEIDGTKIAFLGYNYYDTMLGTGALATSSHAGANSYSADKVTENISEIRDEVDIVIVDFQFQECYSYPSSDVIYPICYKPIYKQADTFRQAIDAGADIVIGTQAHQPQTYELYEDGVIFYGLGNLYFDQTPWIGTRQGMVLTHYFYDGELIQTKITPTIYDSALQVEIADEDDATLLLELLQTARESL